MTAGTANRSSHLASPSLLRKIDELREKNIGQHVPLPQLVVVGDQSSGKSSVLESLTKIPFPRNLELCTRYATQITSRRDPESKVDVAIIPGPNTDDERKKRLAEYRPRIKSTEDFRVQFPEILKEANVRMGIRTDLDSTDGNVFSEDVLKIEICGPDQDYLTIIDVPGIFRNLTEGVTTKKDVALVRNMVEGYIKDRRTIILAVLPSNVDIATQEILTLAEDYDKAGERTLGVLTKPDLVTEHSAKVGVCNLVLGKKRQLALGYHVVQNRGADEDDDSLNQGLSESTLREKPWSELPKDRVGAQSLKARLGELLGQITRREFPGLRRDVNNQLADCRKELEGLGPSRQTDYEQRLFLSEVARRFQDVVQAALNAHYHEHNGFEKIDELKLITHVVNFTDELRRTFERKAQLYYFENQSALPPEGTETPESTDNSEGEALSAEGSARTKLALNGDTDDKNYDVTIIEGIVDNDFQVDNPLEGIMEWIGELHLGSRGLDLGTFGGNILSSAFKTQSSKWNDITMVYMINVVKTINRFMVTALKELCSDAMVRDELWSSILDEVHRRYKAAIEQAAFVVSLERDKRPYTLNHYFNTTLQVSRGNRMADLLEKKARNEVECNARGLAVTSENLVVSLDDVRHATSNKSNAEHVKEEIHDILQSYYKVARKRFVDNVYHQAVDHCLLTGPMSPLSVFSQEWVLKLNPDSLEAIAGESMVTRERRTVLDKKIRDLEDAMRVLRH